MANLQAQALITRIREVLEDSAGTLRTVPAGRFDGNLPTGLSDTTEMRRAFEKPRIAATITGLSRHPASPPINGSLMLYSVAVEVRIVRTVTRLEQLSDADADTLRALATEDADIVRQALEYPGNLTQTTAGAATNIASGLLYYSGSVIRVQRAIDEGSQLLETVHTFTGVAKVYPATA